MNCINHPTAEVSAYCQQCGKPLCNECARAVGGMVYCEPCLAARLGIPPGGQIPVSPWPVSQPHPLLAGLLGFIPGVGAMYNGQFVKGLAHVLIFAIFVSLADHSSIFGFLVAIWVFYQAFDAYHTAKARLAGLPLPNPFGLNDLGARLGISPAPAATYTSGFAADAASPAGTAPGTAPGPAVGQQPGIPPVPPLVPPPPYWIPEPVPPPPPVRGSGVPFGAVALIVLGLALLLQTLGIFRGEWIDRTWPLLIVGLGAWLLYRRTHETPGGGPQ